MVDDVRASDIQGSKVVINQGYNTARKFRLTYKDSMSEFFMQMRVCPT